MDNDKFNFAFRPGRDKEGLGRRIASCLTASGVHTIDYTGRAWPDEFYIKGDGHLTPAGNLELARWLAKDLALGEGF